MRFKVIFEQTTGKSYIFECDETNVIELMHSALPEDKNYKVLIGFKQNDLEAKKMLKTWEKKQKKYAIKKLTAQELAESNVIN